MNRAIWRSFAFCTKFSQCIINSIIIYSYAKNISHINCTYIRSMVSRSILTSPYYTYLLLWSNKTQLLIGRKAAGTSISSFDAQDNVSRIHTSSIGLGQIESLFFCFHCTFARSERHLAILRRCRLEHNRCLFAIQPGRHANGTAGHTLSCQRPRVRAIVCNAIFPRNLQKILGDLRKLNRRTVHNESIQKFRLAGDGKVDVLAPFRVRYHVSY